MEGNWTEFRWGGSDLTTLEPKRGIEPLTYALRVRPGNNELDFGGLSRILEDAAVFIKQPRPTTGDSHRRQRTEVDLRQICYGQPTNRH